MFEDLERAMLHIATTQPHNAKVYNEDGELVHAATAASKAVATAESYA
jgi:hypothetical protein